MGLMALHWALIFAACYGLVPAFAVHQPLSWRQRLKKAAWPLMVLLLLPLFHWALYRRALEKNDWNQAGLAEAGRSFHRENP